MAAHDITVEVVATKTCTMVLKPGTMVGAKDLEYLVSEIEEELKEEGYEAICVTVKGVS